MLILDVHADHITASAYLKSKLPNNVPICIGSGIIAVQAMVKSTLNLDPEEISPSYFDRLCNKV
jgi:hypothetical protein